MHCAIFRPEDGRPAVALHGPGGSTEQNPADPELKQWRRTTDLRTFAIDLPVHSPSGTVGNSPFPHDAFRRSHPEAVRAVETEPTVVLGLSFGSQLAAVVAEELWRNRSSSTFAVHDAVRWGLTW